jgi:hypothetical protein
MNLNCFQSIHKHFCINLTWLKRLQTIFGITSQRHSLIVLDSPATRPVSTRVLTGRVAGLSSKGSLDDGSNPGPVTLDASLYLKARYLYIHTPVPAIVLGGVYRRPKKGYFC